MDMAEPHSPSPEDDGIPGYADDTSIAEDRGVHPTIADDSAPALPTDGPDFSQAFGVTGAQTRHGQSLSQKLAREEPDRNRPVDEGGHVGRLIAPDAGSGIDNEAESIGYDSGEQEGLTAEEAAMHILPTDADPPLE
jgi:hypothetical protein